MPDTDDKIIEAMCREMSEAHGEDPDRMVGHSVRGISSPARHWETYRSLAVSVLAAHRAMLKAEKEQGE